MVSMAYSGVQGIRENTILPLADLCFFAFIHLNVYVPSFGRFLQVAAITDVIHNCVILV
jgi:hypothetical protein